MAAEGAENTALGDLLGITEAALDTADPVSLARGYLGAMRRAALPTAGARVPAVAKYGAGLGLTGAHLVTRALGHPLPEVVHPEPGDRPLPRSHVERQHLRSTAAWRRTCSPRGCSTSWSGPRTSRAARRRRRSSRPAILGDALAPTNFLLTNPRALKRGLRDRRHEHRARRAQLRARPGGERRLAEPGRPLAVRRSGATSPPRPGRSCSATSSSRCSSTRRQTDEVFELPLLVCPPWINRYYIADLAPGKSLVEWAVEHGHTTFAISYRNPDESMRDLTFDDYLRLGPLTAIDVAREIAGSETVNTLVDLPRRHDDRDVRSRTSKRAATTS